MKFYVFYTLAAWPICVLHYNTMIVLFVQQISGRQFQVKVTFVEICDESMCDLLSSQYQRNLVLMENHVVSSLFILSYKIVGFWLLEQAGTIYQKC